MRRFCLKSIAAVMLNNQADSVLQSSTLAGPRRLTDSDMITTSTFTHESLYLHGNFLPAYLSVSFSVILCSVL